MSTDTITEGITREQLKALRNATAAVFRWDAVEGGTTGTLDLSKEVQRGDGFGSDTLRVEIPVSARVQNYGGHRFSDDPEDSKLRRAIGGDWVLLTLKVSPEWCTFAQFLRPGDVVSQEWTVDNRNDLLKRAHLTAHEIKVRVERKGKLHTFILDSCVCDPHSTADRVTRATS